MVSPHRIAVLTAGAAFVLLVIGGMVNATGSSLACPEPTLLCNKQLFPEMVGGVLYEHGHRLAAMTVGLLQIALTVALALRSPELKKLGFVLLGMVIVQGALGAITVGFKLPWFVSTGHLILAMSYFAALIYTAFRTRRPASAQEQLQNDQRRGALGTARRWIAISCAALFVQLMLGALVRHLGAVLVCIGMPTCTPDGDWWGQIGIQHLHMIHRGFGVVVAVITIVASWQVIRRSATWPMLRALMLVAPLLVLAQIGLGVATVLSMRSVPIAVAHFAGAESLWALWMSAWLLTGRRPSAAETNLPELVAVPS